MAQIQVILLLEISDFVELKFNIFPGYQPKIITKEKQKACVLLCLRFFAPFSVNRSNNDNIFILTCSQPGLSTLAWSPCVSPLCPLCSSFSFLLRSLSRLSVSSSEISEENRLNDTEIKTCIKQNVANIV